MLERNRFTIVPLSEVQKSRGDHWGTPKRLDANTQAEKFIQRASVTPNPNSLAFATYQNTPEGFRLNQIGEKIATAVEYRDQLEKQKIPFYIEIMGRKIED